MISRIFYMVFVLVMAAVMITLFVSNRQEVQLILDPFDSKDPAFALAMPFFYFMFSFLFIGTLIGGFAAWFGQGKWRRVARQRTQEAMRWKSEAEPRAREAPAVLIERKQLALAE